MKHLGCMSLLSLCVWLLWSCAEEDGLTVRDKREVTLELPVLAPGLQQTGGALETRSDKVGAEGTIIDNKLWIVQFDGTAAASKVARSRQVTLTDGKVTFPFVLLETGKSRVYVVANANPGVTENTTTLGDFEKKLVAYTAGTTVDASTGLPMCDYKDFDPAGASSAPTFTLKALVAKLTFTCSIDTDALREFGNDLTFTLKNVANGSFYGSPSAYTSAWRPATVSFSKKDLGTKAKTEAFTCTWYVPENIAGQNAAVTRWIQRGVDNAPANATYFEVATTSEDGESNITIALFLGDPATPADFNVRRNYAYTLTATIIGVDVVDQRITMKGDFMFVNGNSGGWTDVNNTNDAFGN